MKSHKAHWRDLISWAWDGYREGLTGDPFENWKRLLVEGRIESELGNAMYLFCGDRVGKESRAYLRRAVAVGERAIEEDKCRLSHPRGFFPVNRGRTLRALAYAQWLLGRRLDSKALIQAANDFKAWCDGITLRSDWEDINEKRYAGAVAMKLLADDVPGALALLDESRPFVVAKPRAAALREVATAASEGKPITKTVAKRFEQTLNSARRPPGCDLIEAFELAAVMLKYIRRPGQKVSPAECLELVSA
jgi:hypothetical protein